MINSKQFFKAGLCSIFGSVAFSIFFWNGYMTETGRHMVWQAFEGDSSFLIFFLFLMPLIMGMGAGFSMIFYSLHLEQKESRQAIQSKIDEKNQLLENENLTSLERLDIIFGTDHNK